MERTMLSWNVPNIITIALMGAGTWAVIAILMQMFQRAGIAPSAGAGG